LVEYTCTPAFFYFWFAVLFCMLCVFVSLSALSIHSVVVGSYANQTREMRSNIGITLLLLFSIHILPDAWAYAQYRQMNTRTTAPIRAGFSIGN